MACLFLRSAGIPLIDPSLNLSKSICGELTILESAEVIRRAKLFIGIDSGPAHLANALGTPGVILMGSYLGFERYIPFSGHYGDGSNARLIFTDGPACLIDVNDVVQATYEVLES